MMRRAFFLIAIFALLGPELLAQGGPRSQSGLPGYIDEPVGSLNSIEMPLKEGPECRKYRIAVPENRAAESSRNIRLYFYRFKARKPSGRAPVFFLPGGPGGFYNDDWVAGLNKKPGGGSNLEAWLYAENRDVVLVNQRGAFRPDRTYQSLVFVNLGMSPKQPYDPSLRAKNMRESAKRAIDLWADRGVDLGGYDIMNMIEDINDIRLKLGYEKIALRGTSFGSQWSMSYMRKYPQHVDRAVLGGTEPIDYGWDSSQGVWNVMGRLENALKADPNHEELGFPDVPLTEAIKTIVKRLEQEPVVATVKDQSVSIGVHDFQNCLLGGIGGHREHRRSMENVPKFVYEVYDENYDFLAAQTLRRRGSFSAMPLQYLLIDNSLGISKAREQELEQEPGRRWMGERNSDYKATRDVTPTPVIEDSFRDLRTDIPLLLVHGDLDLSTPIENADAQMALSTNAHLIRINGGTHGAFDQIAAKDEQFRSLITGFFDAELDAKSDGVASLDLPDELSLPALEFNGASTPPLAESVSQ